MTTLRREKFRKGLHHLYLPIYDALCAELPEEWQPFWGVRSFEEQARLFEQGRTLPGSVVTNAEAGESAHNYGCASDWTIFKDKLPLWPRYDDPCWSVYAAACEKAKARWGGMFKRHDSYHNELPIKGRWAEIGKIFQSKGMSAALTEIERSAVA